MAYEETIKCLVTDTSKNKNAQRDDRIHGGLLLLNELLRVSDVKFEVNISVRLFVLFEISLEYLSRFNSSI